MKAQRIFPLFLSILCIWSCSASPSPKKIQLAKDKDPQYQYNMGLFYLNNSQVDEAVKYLNKALALNPRHYLAWNAMGLANSMKGDLEGSIAAFRKCLEINPQFSEAHNNLGSIYQEMNMPGKAEDEFRKALLDPTYNSRELPLYNLARMSFTQGKLPEAYGFAHRAVQTKPRFAMAHNLKGLILEKMGSLEEAISSYEQAARIVPDDMDFAFNLGLASFKNKDYGRAREVFEKIMPMVTDTDMRKTIQECMAVIGEKQ